MKNKYHRTLVQSVVLSSALVGTAVYAGPVEMTTPPAPTPMEDVVSGVLNLDFTSHFFSYGNDVWEDGDDAFSLGFYPSAELAFALPGGFTATLGVWAELHDKDRPTPAAPTQTLGGDFLEVDTYYGLAYTFDKFTVGVTYQNWFYGGGVEDILDIKFSYDTFLSPSLLIHNRMDAGAAGPLGGDEGTILVLGLSHGIDAGPVSISFPFSLAYFLDDGYHSTTSDSGIGYGSIGVSASVPLSSLIGDAYGDWSVHGGFTYYVTDDGTIGGGVNPAEDSFFITNIGLTLAF
jgi:hypothetical protein